MIARTVCKFLLLVALLFVAPAHAAVQITDGTDNASVDSSGNLNVILPQTPATAGYARVADAAGDPIEIIARDATNATIVARVPPSFYDPIESTTLDVRKWNQPVSTMTITQAAGQITLNAASATASGNVARLTSWQQFPMYGVVGCGAYWSFRFSQASLPTNQIVEMGLVQHTSTTAATSGVYFQTTTSGTFQAVRTFNSGDTTTAVTLTSPNTVHFAKIVRGESSVLFFLDHTVVATMDITSTAATVGSITDTQYFPMSFRIQNSGVASAGNQLIVGPVTVFCDGDDTLGYGHRMARMGSQLQAANGSGLATRTGVQNPNWANSAAPSSATLSNTAGGYTTLGGQYQFAATATNETDWALFAYQNGAQQNLYVTSIYADMCITGAASVNATNFFWAAATSATAVSLAGTDNLGAGTTGPRRLPLFSMGHLAAAAQGACLGSYSRTFDPPLVVEPTRFLHIILKSLNQAATASLVYRGVVGIHGHTGP